MILDTRRFVYDAGGNITRERTKEEIDLIILKDSVTAHREWLQHLEELVFTIIVNSNDENNDKALKKYYEQMENL